MSRIISLEQLEELRIKPAFERYMEAAERIIGQVRSEGDKALRELTKRFDGVELESFMVDREEMRRAYERFPHSPVLKRLARRIKWVESRLLRRLRFNERTPDGFKVTMTPRPLNSVGCYIPGGLARYPSTMLMATVPAKVAGVSRVAAFTPPPADDATLAAAYIAGVDELYLIGGAQAIAAMAYGTESIKPVDKIVGPGGGYVAAAKLLVSRDVSIDFPAGPTELLVIADGGQRPGEIVRELMSQAEHSPDTMVGLLTTSEKLARQVDKLLPETASRVPRGEIILESWRRNGFISVCGSMDEAVETADRIAPEHLSIFSGKAGEIAGKVRNAGIISVNSPSVLSDYVIGVSHILPTWRWARVRGGLSIIDFIKLVYVVNAPRRAIKGVEKDLKTLSMIEDLPNHGEAV